MIHFEIIRILSVGFIAYLFYRIFKGSNNNDQTIEPMNKTDDKNSSIIDFDSNNLQTDFKLKFEQVKNLSGDNYKAVKLINTLQFGTIQIEIFKGSAYSDFDNLHWIELRSLSNEYKTNQPIILSEMDTNDLIILLTFINKI
jgi:hypothetical protein